MSKEKISTESESDQELAELKASWDSKEKAYQTAVADTRDSEFWFAVTFQTRAQKEKFLEALNWIQFGDKYLDGLDIATGLKIELPRATNVAFRGKNAWGAFTAKGGEMNNEEQIIQEERQGRQGGGASPPADGEARPAAGRREARRW